MNIMRNYPLTVMTKSWKPKFPGALSNAMGELLPERIKEVVVNSPRLKTLLDKVRVLNLFHVP